MLAQFHFTHPSPEFIASPYATWAALRTHDPVHHLAPNSVLLTRHADVLAVYRSPNVSSDKQREFGPKYGVGSPLHEHHTTSLVFNDPPLHTRVRRILMGALSQRAITRMEADVQRLVGTLLDGLQERLHVAPGASVCVIEHFAAQIPVEVIGNLLEVPHADRAPLRGWSLAILSALEPAPSAALLEQGHQAVREFTTYLRELVAQRRQHPRDPETDVLTRLIQGDADGNLSEAELLHNCIFLLNAGHETTTNLIGNGVHALLTHRSQWQRLIDAPALINTCVEELLRFESPIQINNRLATGEVQLSDRTLPAGTFITLWMAAANRDPAAFADPEQLDIGRKPNNHLGFGQGMHACSGMSVARMEARSALLGLAQRLPGLTLSDEPPLRDMRLRFRGFKRLAVAV